MKTVGTTDPTLSESGAKTVVEKIALISGTRFVALTGKRFGLLNQMGRKAIGDGREKRFRLTTLRLTGAIKGTGFSPTCQYAESSNTRPPETLWGSTETGHSQEEKEEVKALFPGLVPFSTPRPERFLERIIHIGSNPGDIVLDVFVGSGTTAAVAQKMGRRWVTCELLKSTFTTFTRPRLEKVVNDEDPGGTTRTRGGKNGSTRPRMGYLTA